MGRLRLIRNFIPDRWVKGAIQAFPRLNARMSFSQGGEDLVLAGFLDLRQPGFYVDVGAHDPHRFSNTQIFHRKGWRGINIDPNPEAYRRFQRYRPADINLQVGVSSIPGKLNFHVFEEPAVNTFDAETAKNQTTYRLLEVVPVEVRTLESIFSELAGQGKLPHIDFMSIDVENHELEVLRSNNWERYRPQYLVLEIHAQNIDDLLSKESYRYVKSLGYQMVAKTRMTSVFRNAR